MRNRPSSHSKILSTYNTFVKWGFFSPSNCLNVIMIARSDYIRLSADSHLEKNVHHDLVKECVSNDFALRLNPSFS